jgi:hypothetical protein
MNKLSQSGQGLLEMVFSAFVMSQALMVVCLSLYLLFLSSWIPHTLYELNVCRSSFGISPESCKKRALNTFNLILPHTQFHLQTYKIKTTYGSTLKFSIWNLKTPIMFREEIQL